VARGIGLDKRIGAKFLHAGPGYGGSCFPKDTLALVKTAQDHQTDLSIISSVISANETRKRRMADKIIAACGGVNGKTLGILGLAFKPNTDDMRDAPSLVILPALQEAGAALKAYDPQAMEEARNHFDGVTFCAGPMDAAEGVDAVIVITEWDEFRALSLPKLKAAMSGDVLVDLRNVFSRREAAKAGLAYTGVGRPATPAT
jgi:UDPglucose 6-dehydrogenase